MAKWLAGGIFFGILALLVLDAIAARAGIVAGAVPKLDGQAAWVSSRAAAIAAYLALSLDVIFGLFISTGAADRWVARARSVEMHRFLSTTTLTFVSIHALVLLVDDWIRFDALDLLVPFVTAHHPIASGLGVLAFWGALALHVSFELRKRIGIEIWRRLHKLSFVVFVLATAHGIATGSDTRAPAVLALYGTSSTIVIALVLRRVSTSVKKISRQIRAPN